MSSDFRVTFRYSNDNLHVLACGMFDGNSARELLSLLSAQYNGKGRIFVDTYGLHTILPSGGELFRACLKQTSIPPSQLFFKGENGFRIAPDGSRVLVVRGKQTHKSGCGKCTHCTCGRHH